MARNKDVNFRLGWHVLKNRSFETRNVSAEARDLQEHQFFTTGAWASLSPSTVGIQSLKPRLSNILKDQILQHLPSFHLGVVTGINECQARLKQLGQSRNTSDDQRRYLRQVSWEFSVLMKAAVDGSYVQNHLEGFSEKLRQGGHALLIVEDENGDDSSDGQVTVIGRTAYVSLVKEHMRRSRGCELPGTFNPSIIGELFREQCQPWRSHAICTRDSILRSVSQMAREILKHVASNDTVDALSALVNRTIADLGRDVDVKIEDLLRPHLAGHPITYNHYLISNVQKMQADRRRAALEASLRNYLGQSDGVHKVDLAKLINTVKESEEVDMGSYVSQLATDYMQAYDVSIHAIEERLIQKLPPVLHPERLEILPESQVAHLAAENDTAAHDRAHNLDKLEILKMAMEELQGLDIDMNGITHAEPVIPERTNLASPSNEQFTIPEQAAEQYLEWN